MRRPIIVLLSLLALVAAGCGGGNDGGGGGTSKQDYSHELSQATAALQQAFGELAKGTSDSTSVKGIAARLTRGATALDQAAEKFDAIQPPKASAAAHQKLVEGLHELADVFRKGADAAKHDDAQALAKTLQGLSTSDGAKKITEAQKELLRQGIKVTTAP